MARPPFFCNNAVFLFIRSIFFLPLKNEKNHCGLRHSRTKAHNVTGRSHTNASTLTFSLCGNGGSSVHRGTGSSIPPPGSLLPWRVPGTLAWTPITSSSLPCAGTQDSIGCHRTHGALLFVWPKTTIPRKHSATARDLLIVSVDRACQSRPNTIPSSLSCQ